MNLAVKIFATYTHVTVCLYSAYAGLALSASSALLLHLVHFSLSVLVVAMASFLRRFMSTASAASKPMLVPGKHAE